MAEDACGGTTGAGALWEGGGAGPMQTRRIHRWQRRWAHGEECRTCRTKAASIHLTVMTAAAEL